MNAETGEVGIKSHIASSPKLLEILEVAIEKLESEASVEDYEGKFIRLRDLLFLKEASSWMQIN
ncbi:MAG: hypothetical protein WC052_04055 [Patescibacteria group bacterium]